MGNDKVVNYFGAHPHIDVPDDGSRERPVRTPRREDLPQPFEWTPETVPRGAWVEIDLSAIEHNVKLLHRKFGLNRHLMAVVKADAYGHGAVPVAKAACKAGADYLGVATVEEGIELRRAGLEAPILVLSEPPLRAIPYLLAFDLMPTVCTERFALDLGEEAVRQGVVAKYHLAVDTGMNRIGVHYLDAIDFIECINFHRGIELAGVFTHFATADEDSDWEFVRQLKRFEETLQLMRNARIDTGIVHAANSAAVERYPKSYYDMGRIGIAMYGVAPSEPLRGMDDLRPAMSVKAQISLVKEPQMGEGVSYGLVYRVAKSVQIATIPLGYADGIHRELSGRMMVACNGRICQQVGTICMDQMMIEIPLGHTVRGLAGGAEIGDEVVIIGKQGDLEIPIDVMADELGTVPNELLCAFGMRLPRFYRGA